MRLGSEKFIPVSSLFHESIGGLELSSVSEPPAKLQFTAVYRVERSSLRGGATCEAQCYDVWA